MITNQTQGMSFEVLEILGTHKTVKASGMNLTQEGMVLDTPAERLATNKFMWLEFGLPQSQERIKALAEIVDRSPSQVKVKFKHLFPGQRKKLDAFLRANVSLN